MRVALAAALAALVAAVPAAAADRATVYAASSLTEAFPRIDRSARFSFGGSNLREQVTHAVLGHPDHHHDTERDQHEGTPGVKGVPKTYQHR